MICTSFTACEDGYEDLVVEDMGEGALVLVQVTETGVSERLAVSLSQVQRLLDALGERYADPKNTDHPAMAAFSI